MGANLAGLAQGYFRGVAQLGQLSSTGIVQHLSRALRRQRRETALQSLDNSLVSTPLSIASEPPDGLGQQRRRWLVVDVHLAQRVITDAADLGNLLQLRIGKTVHLRPHPPQQCRAIPLQWPFQRVAPGAVLVVPQDRLIGPGVAGVFDPPLLQRRVEGLFVDIALLSNVGPAPDLVLPQSVRLDSIQGNTALVGGQIRTPQTRLAKRRGDPGHAIDKP
ncbi:hypothetical protein D3C73_761000 [compost metagenome]